MNITRINNDLEEKIAKRFVEELESSLSVHNLTVKIKLQMPFFAQISLLKQQTFTHHARKLTELHRQST